MSDPPPPPQVSPDGKFYWDGERWVPIQAQGGSQPPQPVVVVKQPRGAWNSCVGYGYLAVAAVFVLAAVTAWCSGARAGLAAMSDSIRSQAERAHRFSDRGAMPVVQGRAANPTRCDSAVVRALGVTPASWHNSRKSGRSGEIGVGSLKLVSYL